MILPEVLINQNNVLAERRDKVAKESLRTFGNRQTRMTINVLTTMAVTFVVAVSALRVLVESTVNEALVAGAVATGAAFINLVRRPPRPRRRSAIRPV
jgi:hypothetical protein